VCAGDGFQHRDFFAMDLRSVFVLVGVAASHFALLQEALGRLANRWSNMASVDGRGALKILIDCRFDLARTVGFQLLLLAVVPCARFPEECADAQQRLALQASTDLSGGR